MGRSASQVLLEKFRAGNLDITAVDAVKWSLVKGKTFLQLDYARGLQAYMVQPETMGVLRDDLPRLDLQDAFTHSTWFTEARFADLIQNNPRRDEIIRDIRKYVSSDKLDRPDAADNSRQVVIGGQLYPYRVSGSAGAGQGRGLVSWLNAPTPELDSTTEAKLIRLDELWVWDRHNDDWVTIQLVGNTVIEPVGQFRNLFADGNPAPQRARRIRRAAANDERNPLSGHHPFIEICPNPVPDYFWGLSEVYVVQALQDAINNRVDGINRLLRRQEDPSWLITGATSTASKMKATLRRPGGYHTEQGGAVKVEKMTPDLPAGLWESLHELIGMFDDTGGYPAVLQGQGESGVRAQGHAETLVRMASPRFKDRAITLERQIEELGGLSLDLMRAYDPSQHVLWIKQSESGPFKGSELDPLVYEPPAPGLTALPFQMHHVDDRYRVSVDSHSSSPIFGKEAREVAMLLASRGAITAEDLVRLLNPPQAEAIIADIETRDANKAAMIESLPPDARIAALTGKKPSRSAAH
jgi:hypothetical protein